MSILVGAWLASAVWAQTGGPTPGGRFELADAVELDEADHAVRAQLERVKILLADRQWDEAVEILRQLAETSDGKLLGIPGRRYVGLSDWCQSRLASLPSEALKLYRGRVDPVARKWYEQGLAERNRKLLENVVERAFASSYGDDALMALGEMALESGDYAVARWDWERIVSQREGPGVRGQGSGVRDLAAVGARLVLVSILEGSADRARTELAEFARLHPDAQGRLGGRRGKYVELLTALLANSASWPKIPSDPNWPTFAGNPQRNKIAPPLADIGVVAWRMPFVSPLPKGEGQGVRASRAAPKNADAVFANRPHPNPLPEGEGTGIDTLPKGEEPVIHPLLVGDLVLVNDDRRILVVRRDTGQPAWGQTAAVYRTELAGTVSPPTVPPNALGGPRFTMTVFRNRLFARMGSSVTGQPRGATTADRPGYLVCLDLATEGRLLWKIAPEDGWAFEGSPVADERGVYVAMRRRDVRARAFVACFQPDAGRLRWRRFVCSAETPARGVLPECTHNLLTLAGGMLYYNTNLGAVAALRAEDGRILWVSLYPRKLGGELGKLAPHWRRQLNPCVLDRGTLLVAPADSPRIFAFDAATGSALWQTGTEVAEAVDLLGTTGDWLIAGGGRLYWIGLKGEDRGRVKHVWPDGRQQSGRGRGVLAGDSVLWPTRDKLYIFDQQTARLQKIVDLAARGAAGGNLLAAGGQLLIATDNELIAIGPDG